MKVKKIKKSSKGITLVALVITIIVLLILAGVSIATLTGENGILTRASDASRETEIASVKEQAQLDISNWIAEELENGRDATVNTPEKVQEILELTNQNNEDKYYKGFTETGVTSPNGYEVPYEELYTNSSAGGDVPNFDENTLTLGEAVNTDKYGYIVPEYTVQASTMSSNVWRLFYQDNNYTYLITDEVIGSYRPSDYYSSYANGSRISTIGQRLNSMLLETGTFFAESNTNPNILATAWLTDTSETSMWNEYKNNDVVFVIGSPTIELYVASFNATASANSANQITLGVGTYGYTNNSTYGYLKTSYNYGIYHNDTATYWLASPDGLVETSDNCDYGATILWSPNYIGRTDVVSSSRGVRPIVCIQTSLFYEKYTLSNTEDNS